MAAIVSNATNPMASICTEWLAKIDLAQKAKDERFGKYAKEAMQFFDGAHDWMWSDKEAKGPGGFLDKSATKMPTFRMTVNRVFEAVALFGPALYHQNPNILVTPLIPPNASAEALGIDQNDPDGMAYLEQVMAQSAAEKATKQTQADYHSHYLNWLMVEGDMKAQARRAVTEAIVKGLSFIWIDLHEPKSSSVRYPKASWVSVDDVVIDPDATCWEDVQWVARRCIHPVNKVEEKYGLPPGSIKGDMQSKDAQATGRGKREANNGKGGGSFNCKTYWQVYSKNGFGGRLQSTADKDNAEFEFLGDYCYLAVAKDVPYPLNLPSETYLASKAQAEGAQSQEEHEAAMEPILDAAGWPVPFWMDEECGGGWPFARLYFYDKPGSVWPISLIKPAIGELRFVNWCMSFLADKVAATCTTYVAVAKAAGMEIQNQLKAQLEGKGATPFTILEISEMLQSKSLSDLIQFIQAPNFPADIWTMISAVLELIDKRTGLTELIYGLTSTQMRSATEADVKNQNISIRPDDMANRMEDFVGEVAMKQMELARWVLTGQDMQPVIGQIGAMIWDGQVTTAPVDDIVRSFHFRIEAGTARKPNKSNKIRQLTEFGQFALPIFQQMAATGQIGPFNAYMHDWCKASDMDPTEYLLQPVEPPPDPAQMKAEADIQAKQAEMEMNQQAKGTEMQMDQERHVMEMTQDMQKFQMEQQQAVAENKLQLALLKQKGQVDLQVAKQKGAAQAQAAKIKAKQRPVARK